MCDGSVRFISENIDQRKGSVGTAGYPADIVTNTLGRLACRNDGLVIGDSRNRKITICRSWWQDLI